MAALYNVEQLREIVKKALLSELIPIPTRHRVENRLMKELGEFIHSAIMDRPGLSYYDD